MSLAVPILLSAVIVFVASAIMHVDVRRPGWMKEAGFRDAYVDHLVGQVSMVVGIK